MNKAPYWGPELYEQVNLQRYAFELSGKWSDILRRKRWQLILMLASFILGALILAVCGVVLLYMSYVEKNDTTNEKYVPALLGLFLLYASYCYVRNSLRMIYYLFIDKRDIVKVLSGS